MSPTCGGASPRPIRRRRRGICAIGRAASPISNSRCNTCCCARPRQHARAAAWRSVRGDRGARSGRRTAAASRARAGRGAEPVAAFARAAGAAVRRRARRRDAGRSGRRYPSGTTLARCAGAIDFARLEGDMTAACERVRFWYERLVAEPAGALDTGTWRNAARAWGTKLRRGERRNEHRNRRPGSGFHIADRRRRVGDAVGAARQAGRAVFLSQGRHLGLHRRGLRLSRLVPGFRQDRRRRHRRVARPGQPRTTNSSRSTACRSSSPRMRPARSPSVTASGSRKACMAASTWASTAAPS